MYMHDHVVNLRLRSIDRCALTMQIDPYRLVYLIIELPGLSNCILGRYEHSYAKVIRRSCISIDRCIIPHTTVSSIRKFERRCTAATQDVPPARRR